jgi:acetyltransferase-like isoleucine patch superfamily enzyme
MISAGRNTHVPEDLETNIPVAFGSFCSIASGLVVISGQHPGVGTPEAVSDFPFAEHGWGDYPPSKHDGAVRVGNDVWIGQNVTILDGVAIGDGARIGAGAVVAQNVGPYSVWVGNPARPVKARFTTPQMEALLRIAWWKWDDLKISRALPEMADVEAFIAAHDPSPAGRW